MQASNIELQSPTIERSHPLSASVFGLPCSISGVGLALMLVLFPALASAQATQPAVQAAAGSAPAATVSPDYERRAMQAFANSEWKTALPMLKKVAASKAAQADKLAMIEEYIRVCERNLADPAAAATFDPKTMLAAPGDPPTAADQRKAHARPVEGKIVSMTIKELGNFEYDAEKGGNVPADVLALDGAKVRVNGYMIPLDGADRVSNFALVPTLLACCFGSPPSLHHTIVVHTPKGQTVAYYPDEIVCEGTLRVEEKKDDEFIVSLFEMNVTSVRPAER